MTKAADIADIARGLAPFSGAIHERSGDVFCYFAGFNLSEFARRVTAQADAPAILPQQMRDALVSYRFAQKWATGTEEHRLAIQVADAINPLPPWYEIETPSHTRPKCVGSLLPGVGEQEPETILDSDDKAPCGECHLKPGEVCDVCGRRSPQVNAE